MQSEVAKYIESLGYKVDHFIYSKSAKDAMDSIGWIGNKQELHTIIITQEYRFSKLCYAILYKYPNAEIISYTPTQGGIYTVLVFKDFLVYCYADTVLS